MQVNLTIIAKSDKHTGYCVAAMNQQGKIIRLVRDSEGHALTEEQCKFEKLYNITANVKRAPLTHQSENYILTELLESRKSGKLVNDLIIHLKKPRFIFSHTKPWLTEEEMRKQISTFLFVEIDELCISQNDEGKYKADFLYRNQNYEAFSITDPEFKTKDRKIRKAAILISLPDKPYNKYGSNLYYKFIAAVYPLKTTEKSLGLDCYKI